MFRAVCLFALLAAGECGAQLVGFGIKGGVPASGDIDSYSAWSESKRYVIGPMIDITLPLGFGAEVDALYRRTGFRTANGGFWGSYEARYRANTWEFPMLLKYRLPLPLARPYAEVGYALRHMGGSSSSVGYTVDIPTGERRAYASRGEWNPDPSHGIVTGGGVEFGGRRLRIAPEVRYTRWNNDPVGFYGTQGYRVSAARNQVDVLFGISWR